MSRWEFLYKGKEYYFYPEINTFLDIKNNLEHISITDDGYPELYDYWKYVTKTALDDLVEDENA